MPVYEIRPRLVAAFLGMGIVILAASVFAALILSSVDRDSERIVNDLSRRAEIVGRMRQEFLLVRVAEKNLIIEDTQVGMDVFEGRIRESESEINRLTSEFEGQVEGAARQRLGQFKDGFADFRAALTTMIALSRANTLAKAAEISRGVGRDAFLEARRALIGLIERNRERIAQRAAEPDAVEEVQRLTDCTAAARDALEGLHDLQYLEQAILTVFSNEERAALAARLQAQETRVRSFVGNLDETAGEEGRRGVNAFAAALQRWAESSGEVRRFAQEDSKAKAMALSTSAVRDAYLRASEALDGLMHESDRALSEMKESQEKALGAGRGLLFGTAGAGLLVVGMTAWIVVSLLMREMRAAGDVLMRGG